MAGYDANKAATYNKLRQQGLSEDAAAGQAGIPLGDTNYVISGKYNADGTKNPNPGAMGADIQGSNKVAGVDYDKLTAAEVAENARFDRGLESSSNFEQVDFQVEAKNPPGKVTPINYTTTSTETVSGGGSTTITAGARQPTAASQALQPEITAKQAELNQYIKDNPSDFARKKQGLPPLSPEENEQRLDKLNQLNSESNALKRKQIDAESTTPPTVTTTPNTTTTTQTVTTGTSSSRGAVDPGNDEKLSQENETQLDATASPANASTARSAAPVSPVDDPFEQSRLDAEQRLNDEPIEFEPADVNPEDDPFEAERLEREQELNRQELAVEASEPEPVSPAEDPFEQSRLDAEQRLNDEPIEFEPADVDPADDPFEAERLEREQELNRQELSETATEAEPVDAEQLGNDYGFTSEETEGAEPTPLGAEPDSTAAMKALVKSQGTLQSRYKQPGNGDWRVRLSLAPYSDYLYNATGAGILAPLTATNGVIFPYTPNISTTYSADYEKYNLIHSNYRGLFYKSSSVGDVQVRGTFTAQDTKEAAYMLAVIHFFRSVTKMFYGQDAERGTPPPLVYLSGYGDQQFNNHACVVGSFNYSLPNEVDYIRTNGPNNFGPNMSNRQTPTASSPGGANFSGAIRLANALLNKGAIPQLPAQNALRSAVNNTNECTYVPTKMEIDITLIPVQTRSQVSKQFSLKEFANGNLLKKGFW